MEQNVLDEIEHILSYQFRNKMLLVQAFTRSSYAKEHNTIDNEVLEFLGDTILNQLVVSRLIGYYTNEEDGGLNSELSESHLTEYKIKLVNKNILSSRIDILCLSSYLLLGKGDKKNKVYNQDSVKEDLFEAIIGAVTIDSDYDWDVLSDLIDTMLDIDSYIANDFEETDENSIGALQSWSQKRGYGAPEYSFREVNNFFSGQEWHCYLNIGYNRFEGKADSKIDAKKICAQRVIDWLIESGSYYNMADEIDEPTLDKAINQLQELSQKGYFSNPTYEFEESQEEGEVAWESRIDIDEYDFYYTGSGSTKKEAKKEAAYNMLLEVLKLEEKKNDK